MRCRFIKPGEKSRLMIRGPFTKDILALSEKVVELGFEPATLLQFIKHMIFWRKRFPKSRD